MWFQGLKYFTAFEKENTPSGTSKARKKGHLKICCRDEIALIIWGVSLLLKGLWQLIVVLPYDFFWHLLDSLRIFSTRVLCDFFVCAFSSQALWNFHNKIGLCAVSGSLASLEARPNLPTFWSSLGWVSSYFGLPYTWERVELCCWEEAIWNFLGLIQKQVKISSLGLILPCFFGSHQKVQFWAWKHPLTVFIKLQISLEMKLNRPFLLFSYLDITVILKDASTVLGIGFIN